MKLSKLAPITLIISALAITACANTVRGVGRDVKGTVKAVEDTVQ